MEIKLVSFLKTKCVPMIIKVHLYIENAVWIKLVKSMVMKIVKPWWKHTFHQNSEIKEIKFWKPYLHINLRVYGRLSLRIQQ